MENFEGGHNPEIKDIKKLGWRARLGLAAAVIFGSTLDPNIQDTPAPKIPDEIRSDDPPKLGTSQVTPKSTPKNV